MNTCALTEDEIVAFYNRHVDMLYRICFTLLKSASDAEDAVQTVFLKVIEKNRRFDTLEHEKAWLIVVAQNHCKNKLTHWWQKNTPLDIDQHQSQYTQESDEVLELVLKLPDKYKIPVYLYYYEGYNTDEIAKVLDINPSTLRSRLKKARELLKLTIGEKNDD